MHLSFQHGDETLAIELQPEDGGWRVRLPDGSVTVIQARRLDGDIIEVRTAVDGIERTIRVPFARMERRIEISWRGNGYAFAPTTGARSRRREKRGSGLLTAPMVGTVVEVRVSEGDIVEPYQPLAVVEAMKVMAMLEAPFAGTVSKVYVQAGARVAHGEPIVEVTPIVEATPVEEPSV